eukprot:CAMPEP_0202961396 /NCGR_PEP_ID=MMETSP1396-20130829/5447_1 /ASSEMBLY_ACC=CAM_ASM_000872 /TAXON_ID= /ORGANISM="Pseudokeronopsis sp., Strain Brazil" /LENGTH=98 /DNA_ID=CAMNT_0049681173 /DNA_START=587 /DNA_END=883 /DNA_ORIENTATION=-
MTHAFQQEYIDYRERKQNSEKERLQVIRASKRSQNTKSSNLRMELIQKNLNNQSFDTISMRKPTKVEDSTRLPPVKKVLPSSTATDDELLKLLKKNQH